MRLAGDLRQRRFELAILFQNAFEAAVLTWAARIPRRLDALGTTDPPPPAVMLVGPEPTPPGPWTVFTGTDPDAFMRHGPLIHLPMIHLTARPLAA